MISFIVPAHNEEQHIRRTLEAIHVAARSTGEPYEIVVVDDASTDRTHDFARECGARVIDVNKRQIAATRNAGAHAAAGDLLFFVDADTLVTPDAVRRAVQALRAGAVGGGATIRFDGPLRPQFRLLVRLTVAASRGTKLAFGCFIFCTAAAFHTVRGFNETLYASEEIAFSRALKRHGRFFILRETVITSGRKLRAHTAREVWRALGHATLQMLGFGRGRRGLEAWYGERRQDPGPIA